MDAGVVLGGELLAADVAGMLRGRRRVILADVVHQAVLALAHHSALRALFVAWKICRVMIVLAFNSFFN